MTARTHAHTHTHSTQHTHTHTHTHTAHSTHNTHSTHTHTHNTAVQSSLSVVKRLPHSVLVGARAGDGTVNTIPYSDNKPEFAKAGTWPSMEYYGQVLAYIDVERRPAPYTPPAIAGIDNGTMVYRGRHKYGVWLCSCGLPSPFALQCSLMPSFHDLKPFMSECSCCCLASASPFCDSQRPLAQRRVFPLL